MNYQVIDWKDHKKTGEWNQLLRVLQKTGINSTRAAGLQWHTDQREVYNGKPELLPTGVIVAHSPN